MRRAWIALLAACGGGSAGPPLTASASFVVTNFTGANPSPLDPLQNRPISIDVVFPDFDSSKAVDSGCKTTVVARNAALRTALDVDADIVQAQLLDMLPDWDVRFQLCDGAGQSSVILHSEVAWLNLEYGCFGIPPSAVARDANGYPELTSFTATQCNSTILDVVNNRVIGNSDFTMTFAIGTGQIP